MTHTTGHAPAHTPTSRELVEANYARLKAQNDALVEALRATLMNAQAPHATDWAVVVNRLEAALALAEKGLTNN